jgi:hypothetical protein
MVSRHGARDSIQPTNAKRQQHPIVLESAELALDGGATPIELAPARSLARDQRVEAISLVLSHRRTHDGCARSTWQESRVCTRYSDTSPADRSSCEAAPARWPPSGARARSSTSARAMNARGPYLVDEVFRYLADDLTAVIVASTGRGAPPSALSSSPGSLLRLTPGDSQGDAHPRYRPLEVERAVAGGGDD